MTFTQTAILMISIAIVGLLSSIVAAQTSWIIALAIMFITVAGIVNLIVGVVVFNTFVMPAINFMNKHITISIQ